MDRDDEIWQRMLIWTAERTALSTEQIDDVFTVSSEFWMAHAKLAGLFMSGEDEAEPWN